MAIQTASDATNAQNILGNIQAASQTLQQLASQIALLLSNNWQYTDQFGNQQTLGTDAQTNMLNNYTTQAAALQALANSLP